MMWQCVRCIRDFLLKKINQLLNKGNVRFVPEADIVAIDDELLDYIVQRKSNEQHSAGNVDVFFKYQWVGFFY